MKKVILATVFASMLAMPAMAETIRMGTEGAYPPYNFINDKNEVDGFEREVGDEICARANLDCVWVVNDWDSIIPNLVSGNYDTIIAGMSITAERDEVIDFTQEYFPPSPSMYVGLSDSSVDVNGGIIAAQTGTIQAGHVASSGATLVEFATPDETVAAVRNGEADAVLADGDYLMPIVSESGGELAVVGQVGIGGGIGMGIRESDTALKAKMDTAIASMKSDGTLNTMIKKWFGDDALTF
ncbi:MAG: transporter substrate-binding domain-containing protein [Alphaproteobacteria bacterium]|jgi:polar amino acid transport system substrate-binding protein|nr:transporter substrate-binding domain-containing protein [Alphaproteobacteria bacterium]MDG2465830.1 transporter substrate-binding domain-containing protein [Alphaproteobacteria bacterium]